MALGEQTRGSLHIKLLLPLPLERAECGPDAAQEPLLSPAELGIRKPAGDHPRPETETGKSFVEVLRSPFDHAWVHRLVEAERAFGDRARGAAHHHHPNVG